MPISTVRKRYEVFPYFCSTLPYLSTERDTLPTPTPVYSSSLVNYLVSFIRFTFGVFFFLSSLSWTSSLTKYHQAWLLINVYKVFVVKELAYYALCISEISPLRCLHFNYRGFLRFRSLVFYVVRPITVSLGISHMPLHL